MKYIAYLILILTICFNLYLYYPETKILADPNDNIFQYSLLQRTNWAWENYGCPISFSCLPNLTDHVVTVWAEGYPLPFYYSHIPQIATVASYKLIIHPIASIFQPKADFTLYQYYNWTKYLLLCFFPITVFIALRVVGFSPLLSAFGAFFASHFSTDGLYGIDPPSFLWRGYGLTSQLYGQIFMPLAIAFVYKALSNKGYKVSREDEVSRVPRVENSRDTRGTFNTRGTYFTKYILNLFFAIFFLTLTTAGHLGIGMLTFISLIPFIFIDFKPHQIFGRIKTLTLIYLTTIIALSYWIIPTVLANNYHLISFWDPIWKFDSYGWYEVIRQYLSGEIFDWQRIPVITILATIGFFALIINTRLFPFALLFAFWFLMYFGRTTWGGLIDLIPGMKDFHQHRFIVGIQIAALFLIPGALDWIIVIIKKIVLNIFALIQIALKTPRGWQAERREAMPVLSEVEGTPPMVKELINNPLSLQNIISYIFFFILISTFAYLTIQQTINYNSLNTRWIDEANKAYQYDEKNFQDLTDYLGKLPPARVYAGRPGNWGHDFRLGSTQMYMNMAIAGFDVSQFLPETWSPMSENEQDFDERAKEDYNLLNIKYIVSPNNQGLTDAVKFTRKFGPFELYEVPTSGWFEIVTSPMLVKTDKTNFVNLVHLWHRSYPRLWKMHPLISVEKNPAIPKGVQKVIRMTDEVSYKEESASQGITSGGIGEQKNIFSDFPFVFPEATISSYLKKSDKDTLGEVAESANWRTRGRGISTAIISNEKINKQTYSATIEVPNNCTNCYAMFKVSYHPNWQVKVDGQQAQKYSVFPFYLATPITPGTHNVEFYYQPSGLKVVLILIEISLIFVGGYIIIRKIIKKE